MHWNDPVEFDSRPEALELDTVAWTSSSLSNIWHHISTPLNINTILLVKSNKSKTDFVNTLLRQCPGIPQTSLPLISTSRKCDHRGFSCHLWCCNGWNYYDNWYLRSITILSVCMRLYGTVTFCRVVWFLIKRSVWMFSEGEIVHR